MQRACQAHETKTSAGMMFALERLGVWVGVGVVASGVAKRVGGRETVHSVAQQTMSRLCHRYDEAISWQIWDARALSWKQTEER